MMAAIVTIYSVLIRFSIMQNYEIIIGHEDTLSDYLPDSNNLVIIP